MNNHRALTLQLSARDLEQLETRARSHRVTAEAMAQMLLHSSLDGGVTSPLLALQAMAELRQELAPVDVVEIVRQGRGHPQSLKSSSNGCKLESSSTHLV